MRKSEYNFEWLGEGGLGEGGLGGRGLGGRGLGEGGLGEGGLGGHGWCWAISKLYFIFSLTETPKILCGNI